MATKERGQKEGQNDLEGKKVVEKNKVRPWAQGTLMT